MSPQAALLFLLLLQAAAAARRSPAACAAVRAQSPASLASVRLSTFHTLWRNASRFFWYSVTLLSFGGAAWYSKSTRACAKQKLPQGRTGQHYPFHQ
ncbi:hypothetical protein M8494_14430 [Serratia ureilytica]